MSAQRPSSLRVSRVHPSIVPHPHTVALRTPDPPTILIAFESPSAAVEWLCLLRSISPRSNGHLDRRIHIDVFDVEETNDPATPPGGMGDSTSTSHLPSQASLLSGTEASQAGSSRPRAKAGWSQRYKLAAELWVLYPGIMLTIDSWTIISCYAQRRYVQKMGNGRTGAPRIISKSFVTSPRAVRVNDLTRDGPQLISALRLYRLRKDRFELFATVDLPLVCDFQSRQDDRYPVKSRLGVIIGEIRLAVSYYESSCWVEDAKVVTVSLFR